MGLFPLGASPRGHGRAAARCPGRPSGVAIPSGACADAAERAHAEGKGKKVRGRG
jgi:hypothetical protein